MKRRMTMADISDLAGVSISTVSRALSGSTSIPEKTRERIIAIARAHNYVLDERARNFRLQRSQTVALVFPYLGDSHRMISDPFYMEMLGAVTDALDQDSYDVVVSRVPGADDAWCEHYIVKQRVDGLIIVDRSVNDPGIAALNRLNANFVVWGPPMPGQDAITVGCDSIAGGRTAVQHLLALGRRRIGFIGGHRGMVETHQRFIGYRQGMESAGFAIEPELVAYTDFTPQQGLKAAQRMLEAVPDLDGLFICSDVMSIAIMEYLRASGRIVPDDVSVVGYDDIQLAAYCSPRLTTIRQHIDQGGALLVARLLDLIEGRDTESVTLNAELIVRDSCGARA
jgi:DNA-binding LacI/PurR family transcriptional regulator